MLWSPYAIISYDRVPYNLLKALESYGVSHVASSLRSPGPFDESGPLSGRSREAEIAQLCVEKFDFSLS
jgi:hypothetical protein